MLIRDFSNVIQKGQGFGFDLLRQLQLATEEGRGGRDCFPNVLVPFTFLSSQPLTEVKDSRKDAVHVNNKLLLGLELASYIQAAYDSKRTDSPA